MNPAAFLVFVSVVLYAICNVIAERLFKGNHPLWSLIIANGLVPIFSLLCFGVLRFFGCEVQLKTPQNITLLLAVACPFLLFIGHMCVYTAYGHGVNVMTATTILCLMPFIGAAIDISTGGKAPVWNEFVAALLVVSGIFVLIYFRVAPPHG